MKLEIGALEMDLKLQLIQELIPLGLMHVGEILTEEVKALAGERYKRNGKPGHVRSTKQWGSVYIGEQKLPILYQRVRDRRKGRKVLLGFIQAGTENASLCKDFLNNLLDRGLNREEGMLCIMDGSKGIRGSRRDLWEIRPYPEVPVA